MSESLEQVTSISAYYGILTSVLSGFLKCYATHTMKRVFIREARLGNVLFRRSEKWLLGLGALVLSFVIDVVGYALSTFILTIPVTVASALLASRVSTSFTFGVVRWSDVAIIIAIVVGIVLVATSVTPDDIVYSPEVIGELAEEGGSVSIGVIGTLLCVVNVWWMYGVAKTHYDDYLLSLVTQSDVALIPREMLRDKDETMQSVYDDMKSQSLELEVELLLTRPKNASDVTNVKQARREIRRLRRVLNDVTLQQSKIGDTLSSAGEIHLHQFKLKTWSTRLTHALVASLWATLVNVMAKAGAEIFESILVHGWTAAFLWHLAIVLSSSVMGCLFFAWSINRGMHEHGNVFLSTYKMCYVTMMIVVGIGFYREDVLIENERGGAYTVGAFIILTALFLKYVETTRLMHVEVSMFAFATPLTVSDARSLCCGSQRVVRLARFVCPSLATLDAIAFTDCDQLPSMNEAKLHWCRLASVMKQSSRTRSGDSADVEDESTGICGSVDVELHAKDVAERDVEMGMVRGERENFELSRNDNEAKDMSEDQFKRMPFDAAQRLPHESKNAIDIKGRGKSEVNLQDFHSVCESATAFTISSHETAKSTETNDIVDVKVNGVVSSSGSQPREVESVVEEWRRRSTGISSIGSVDGRDHGEGTSSTHRRRGRRGIEVCAMSHCTLRPLLSTEGVDAAQRFSEPNDFHVRGPNYLIDRVKILGGAPMLRLLGVDLHDSEVNVRRHVMSQPQHHAYRFQRRLGREESLPWFFVVNFIVPTGNVAAYWTPGMTSRDFFKSLGAGHLVSRFVNGSDNFRNQRLKLIPKIVSGNWFVRKVVGSKPAILGTKGLAIKYFRTRDYLEIDIDLTQSRIANGIFGVVQQYVESIVVDLAFVIESQHMTELPESVLCGVRFHHGHFEQRVNPLKKDEHDEKEGMLRVREPTG